MSILPLTAMDKKILITGITGMLGSAVYRYFFQKKEYKIVGISRNQDILLPEVEMFYGDLASDDLIHSISTASFDYIIHCAAEVNVNLCETDKEHAYKSNVLATKNLFSKIKSKKYLYISTDAVFDGSSGNYSEESFTNPLNYYAITKLLGEDAVKDAVKNYYILRTNIFGFNTPMKKSLFEWGFSELDKGKTINGFSNMYFNPMYVGQLATLIAAILTSNIAFGTYHAGTNEIISKFDFLAMIAKSFQFDAEKVNKIQFDPKDSVAPRALNTTLNNSKTRLVLNDFDFSLEQGFNMLVEDLKKANDVHEKN